MPKAQLGGIDFSSKASGAMSAPGVPPGLSKSGAQSTPSADGTAFVSKSKQMTMMAPPTIEGKSMAMMTPKSMMPPPTMEPAAAFQATSKAKTSAFAFQAPVGLPSPAGVPLPDEREYVVENTLLQAASEGMAYRSSKSWDDRADAQVNWGETVRGRDEGDGWLKVRRPSGVLYLPFKANGKLVVYQKEAPAAAAKTAGMAPAQGPLDGPRLRRYFVDNSKLKAASEGLQFRGSKSWEDRASAQIHWGEIVTGVDEGDGWLKVGNMYLPFVANDVPVLALDSQDPLADFYAVRN